MVLLYDVRADSPTRGVLQKVVMSDRVVRSLTIPTHVWHLNLNLGRGRPRPRKWSATRGRRGG